MRVDTQTPEPVAVAGAAPVRGRRGGQAVRPRRRDRATVGDRANLYNMALIDIGARAIVAQETYLCTGTHDFDDPHLPLQSAPICVGEDAFVSARTFVLPGVSIGARSIVGAASVVTRDVPPDVLAAGNPCRVI